MKKTLYAAAGLAALTTFAAPAYAQDDDGGVAPFGPRIEVIGGLDAVKANTNTVSGATADVEEEHGFAGVRAGFDMPLGSTAAIGVDVEATTSFVDSESTTLEARAGRDLYAGGRLSLLASDTGNLYVTAGYTNFRFTAERTVAPLTTTTNSLDGVRGGIGFQLNLGSGGAFANLEYRYSNYEADVQRHQGAIGFGFRF